MIVSMELLGEERIIDIDGSECSDGADVVGYKDYEVPEDILHEVIVTVFSDNYGLSLATARNIIEDYDLWYELEEDNEDEIKERIEENYNASDLIEIDEENNND